MPDGRMLCVATTADAFHARVIAARLGAEGFVWELRGNVGGPYPVGQVEVLVAAPDYDSARELLLADEVESVFDVLDDEAAERSVHEAWLVATALTLAVLFVVARLAQL